MGYMSHHTIAVTVYGNILIEMAREEAIDIFGEDMVTNIYKSIVGGYFTFYILPDGCKERWDISNDFDKKRPIFINWINDQKDEDGDNKFAYCLVGYGDDEGNLSIDGN